MDTKNQIKSFLHKDWFDYMENNLLLQELIIVMNILKEAHVKMPINPIPSELFKPFNNCSINKLSTIMFLSHANALFPKLNSPIIERNNFGYEVDFMWFDAINSKNQNLPHWLKSFYKIHCQIETFLGHSKVDYVAAAKSGALFFTLNPTFSISNEIKESKNLLYTVNLGGSQKNTVYFHFHKEWIEFNKKLILSLMQDKNVVLFIPDMYCNEYLIRNLKHKYKQYKNRLIARNLNFEHLVNLKETLEKNKLLNIVWNK